MVNRIPSAFASAPSLGRHRAMALRQGGSVEIADRPSALPWAIDYSLDTRSAAFAPLNRLIVENGTTKPIKVISESRVNVIQARNVLPIRGRDVQLRRVDIVTLDGSDLSLEPNSVADDAEYVDVRAQLEPQGVEVYTT